MNTGPGSMGRVPERVIDVIVLTELLGFAWLMRDSDPALAGVVVAASVQFWMAKNATAPRNEPNDLSTGPESEV